MKKRILFVDDEPLVLQGLGRMLRSLREEWIADFAESGADALQLMTRQDYDIVVADMRMPGMTGAELLNKVMKLYPQTIRLILSGHADKDMVVRCVGSTHQYLSKPCEAEMLRATIQRAARTEAVLSQTGLAKIIGKMNRLPSLPSVYIEILDALRDPDRDLTDIGRIVGRDIAMTAQILKLVNSAFFGLRREISNPTEAVHFIGVETLKHLVLSAHLFTEFQKARASGFCLNNLSDHSLSTAKGSHIITRIEQSDCSISEEAFCAGMLHDTGKLVLAHNFPTQYSHILQDSHTRHLPLHTLEKERLGADHAEIGGYLLGLWGLPVRVVEAITLHHNPSVGSFEKMSPLLAVCSANFLVQNLHHNPPPPPPPPLEDLLSQQGFSEHWNLWHQSLQDQIASA